MGAVKSMVAKDLRRKARAPLGLLVTLSFPLVFSLLIALTFGGSGTRIPKVHLLIENKDDGPVGNVLLSVLDSNEIAEYFDVEVVTGEGRKRIEENDGSALLTVPENFSRDILEGNPASLHLLRNPAQTIMPEVAEQMAGVLAEILNTASYVLREPMEKLVPFTRSGAVRITDETVAALAVEINRTMYGAERFLIPPVITLDVIDLQSEEEQEEPGGAGRSPTFSIFLYILPGFSVYALFLVGDLGMRDILTETTSGTLRRQFSGPLTAGKLITAKAAYTAVLSGFSLMLLAAIAAIAMDRGIDPLGFIVLSVSLVVLVTGAASTVYGISGNERRGATIAAIIYLVLAFSGGSLMNVEALPPAIRTISPYSPFYWATTGFRSLMESGAGLADLLPNIGILGGGGTVLLLLGSALLGRRIRKGGAS